MDGKHDSNTEALITTAEAAKLLCVAPITLAKWRLAGSGPPFVAAGRAIRYRPSALMAWAEARTRRSTSEATVAASREEAA